MTDTYRDFVELTVRTIGTRARVFRNLVGTVIGLTACVIMTVTVCRCFPPLLLLLGNASAVAFFLARDHRILVQWKVAVLDAWSGGRLDAAMLAEVLAEIPNLPQQTIDDMIGTLGPAKNGTHQDVSRSLKRAFISGTRAVDDVQSIRLYVYGLVPLALLAGSVVFLFVSNLWGIAGVVSAILAGFVTPRMAEGSILRSYLQEIQRQFLTPRETRWVADFLLQGRGDIGDRAAQRLFKAARIRDRGE